MSTEVTNAPGAGGVSTTTTDKKEPLLKVFVGNLAYATTQESLEAFFKTFAPDFESVQITQRRNRSGDSRSAGYAFVTFKTEPAAQKAVADFEALPEKQLDSRSIVVALAKPKPVKEETAKDGTAKETVKSTKKSKKTTTTSTTNAAEAAVASVLTEKTEGTEGTAKKRKRQSRKTKKAGEVAPGATTETATNATTEKPKPKAPKVKKEKRPHDVAPEGVPSKNTVFVANLGFEADDAALAALFKAAGIDVVQAHVITRKPYRHNKKKTDTAEEEAPKKPLPSKGFGFVDVGTEENQQKAISLLHDTEVNGRKISVKIAINPDKPTTDAPKVESTEVVV